MRFLHHVFFFLLKSITNTTILSIKTFQLIVPKGFKNNDDFRRLFWWDFTAQRRSIRGNPENLLEKRRLNQTILKETRKDVNTIQKRSKKKPRKTEPWKS